MEQIVGHGDGTKVVIDALNCLLDRKRHDRETVASEIRAIEKHLAKLQAGSKQEDIPRGVTPLAAAVNYARAVQRPVTTPEIVQEALAMGMVTRAKNPVASMYATLRNSPKFRREGDYWVLVETS